VLKTQPNDTTRVKLLNDLSADLIISDKYDSALIVANQALVLSDRLNYQQGIASSYRKAGVAYIQKCDYPKGLDYLLKSLKNQDKLSIAENILLHNNIGMIYYYRGDYSKALEYFFQVSNFNGNNPLTNENIGMAYLGSNEFNLSLKYFNRALTSYQDNQDKNSIGRVFNSIGTIYENKGELDGALKYYLESLKIKRQIIDNQGISDAMASIGDIFYKQKKYSESIRYENQSIEIAKKIRYMISVQQTDEELSKIYSEIGDNAKALYYYRNYIGIRDSLYNEEATKRTVREEESYKYDVRQSIEKSEQDKKDLITTQEKKRQRIIIYSISGGLFLVLLFSIILFRGYQQTKRATIIISKQKNIVDDKNKEITDSIRYASRIQQAILPPDIFVCSVMPEHLIYFTPKDIVSGDFYFIERKNDDVLWATCDATGHGASGAMLSMLGLNILSGIVKDGETIPSKILDKLNESINQSLHKTGDDSIRDGMDVSLCSLNTNTLALSYAGANNPLWIIRNGSIIEYKADKMPIGQMYKSSKYTNQEIQLQKNDCIYSFSDGICDLHSEENKKFMKKRLRDLLISIQEKSMTEQKLIISETLQKWQGNAEQVDDMLLIGIRV
jgi:serine phosphatase RsbU (regulator of sigma subunit)